MPRRGEAVMVSVTSGGTCALTRSSTSSVGSTSYRGACSKPISPWRVVWSVRPMRPSSRAWAPGPERTRPLTTSPSMSHYTALSRSAQRRLAMPGHQQDHVAIERRAPAAGFEAGDRDVACQLSVQAGQLSWLDGLSRICRSVMVDHRAGDGEKTVACLEELDRASLAWPVDDGAGGHLP